MNEPLSDLKARFTIAQAWRELGLAGEPAKICRSPFPSDHKNGDAHPSFSVFSDGARWKNQATGEGGDVFDLVKKARACDMAAAIAWVRERVGIVREPVPIAAAAAMPSGGTPWPPLRAGTAAECTQLAKIRYIAPEAVKLASEHKFLHFGELFRQPFWAVTDQRRKLIEFRRLDGAPWPAFGRLSERKSHCLGSGKDFPIGTLEAASAQAVAWLEGAPDLLAFFTLLGWRRKQIQSRPSRCSAQPINGSPGMLWRDFTANTWCSIPIATLRARPPRKRGHGNCVARVRRCRPSTFRASRKTTVRPAMILMI